MRNRLRAKASALSEESPLWRSVALVFALLAAQGAHALPILIEDHVTLATARDSMIGNSDVSDSLTLPIQEQLTMEIGGSRSAANLNYQGDDGAASFRLDMELTREGNNNASASTSVRLVFTPQRDLVYSLDGFFQVFGGSLTQFNVELQNLDEVGSSSTRCRPHSMLWTRPLN